jgi:HEAT repeat protein
MGSPDACQQGTDLKCVARLLMRHVAVRQPVQGLRNAESEAALEPLSKARDDSDFWVRWEAVMALATITHQKE